MCKDILKSDYISQKTFDWLINETNHHLFCDGYFEKLGIVIEFDGVTHRKPINTYGGVKSVDGQKHNDSIKDNLLRKHNIIPIRIDSRKTWYTQDGMINILKDEFKKNDLSFDLIIG